MLQARDFGRHLYEWKAKYGGLDVSEARRLKALEGEDARLKELLAESMLNEAAALALGEVFVEPAKRKITMDGEALYGAE